MEVGGAKGEHEPFTGGSGVLERRLFKGDHWRGVDKMCQWITWGRRQGKEEGEGFEEKGDIHIRSRKIVHSFEAETCVFY